MVVRCVNLYSLGLFLASVAITMDACRLSNKLKLLAPAFSWSKSFRSIRSRLTNPITMVSLTDLLKKPLFRYSAWYRTFAVILLPLVYRRPAHSPKVPKLRKNGPVLGAARYFTERFEFFRDGVHNSASGNFSFWLGSNFVMGLLGDESRQTNDSSEFECELCEKVKVLCLYMRWGYKDGHKDQG